MPALTVPKKERLETRVASSHKKLFERAAAMRGQTLTDFVTTSLIESAISTVKMFEGLELGAADSKAFATTLLNPPKAPSRLAKAAKKYQQRP